MSASKAPAPSADIVMKLLAGSESAEGGLPGLVKAAADDLDVLQAAMCADGIEPLFTTTLSRLLYRLRALVPLAQVAEELATPKLDPELEISIDYNSKMPAPPCEATLVMVRALAHAGERGRDREGWAALMRTLDPVVRAALAAPKNPEPEWLTKRKAAEAAAKAAATTTTKTKAKAAAKAKG